MSGMSDRIEAFILQLLSDDNDDWCELRRNELAGIFNCVPSQINYVISTRFNEGNGYIVESRRGGGGYLRIKRINYTNSDAFSSSIEAIGNDIDFNSAYSLLSALKNRNLIDDKTFSLFCAAISDRSLIICQPQKNILRANILKNMLKQEMIQ